jgi:two-component system cell cycle response regulator
MTALSQERTDRILKQMAEVSSLPGLLDLFGEQIEALGIADGYLVNMPDPGGRHLLSLKLRLMPEFENLEQTYQGYKHSVDGDLLNARVMKTRSIDRLTLSNASDAEKFVLRAWKVEEIVGVPLVAASGSGAIVGALVLLKQSGSIGDAALGSASALIELFHQSLANWLRFSHLEQMHDQARAAVEENTRLLQFLDEMNSLTSVDKIFELFAKELFRQIPFDLAGFSLVEGDLLRISKCIGRPEYQSLAAEWESYLASTPYRLDPSESGAVYVLLRNEPMIFRDIQEIMHLPMADHDARSIALLKTPRTLFISPIRYHRKAIGILAFYSLTAPVTLSEGDLHLLEQLSSFLGTAVANGRLYATSLEQNLEIGRLNLRLQDKIKELDELASTDRLTGLYNYRIFEQELSRRLNESSRSSPTNELSLALIDIDHFKIFNDNHGHAAGNEVLAGVAQEIGKLIRQSDMACRYGGEEFVVILPKCDLAGVNLLAERIRQTIAARIFDTPAGPQSVTVSIGCAVHQQGESGQELFARADAALYRAKGEGRNRIASA